MTTHANLSPKVLRQALRSWSSSQKLGEHPLAQMTVVAARRRAAGYGENTLGHGLALRDVLYAALGQLRPHAGAVEPLDRQWRAYYVLSEQYLHGRAPDYVAAQLGIARSTYDHEQVGALEALAEQLGQQEDAAHVPEAVPLAVAPPSQGSAHTPFLALPRRGLPLVGRAELLTALEQGAVPGGVHALNGLPGVGKTALAIELVHSAAVRAQFPDGVLWAGLGRQPDVLALLGLWASALGLPLEEIAKLTRVEERARAIHAAIGLRRMVLVIDDAWQLTHALAFRLGGPQCVHVLTTRLPALALDFAGECVTTVRELEEVDAVALLAQVAPGVAGEALEEARGAVREVGGLPLALELMGRYLQREARAGQPRRLRTALERLRQVEERLTLTQAASPLHSGPQSNLSILSVVEVSAEQLDAPARRALRAVALFPPKPNSFSEAAALAVSGAEPDVLDALCDAGLLESPAAGRYGLHQTIAEYAAHAGPPEPEMVRRFVAHCVEVVEQKRGRADQPFELELANCLAAWQAAYAAGLLVELVRGVNAFFPLLEMRGLQALAEPHVDRALTAARHLPDMRGLSTALNHAGNLARHVGAYVSAEAYFQEGLALARAMGSAEVISAFLQRLGVLAFSQGHYAVAGVYYREGIELARAAYLHERLSALLSNLGALALNTGESDEAERCFQEGLALARATGNAAHVSALLINLGVITAQRGARTEAEAYFEESLELARAGGYREAICLLLTNLGALANDRHERARAEAYFQEALSLARVIDDRARISLLLTNLGALALADQRKDYDLAERYFQEGLTLARARAYRENVILLLINLGELEFAREHWAQAEGYWRAGVAEALEIGHQRYHGILLGFLEKLNAGKG